MVISLDTIFYCWLRIPVVEKGRTAEGQSRVGGRGGCRVRCSPWRSGRCRAKVYGGVQGVVKGVVQGLGA
jgi:hypothetical protein